MRNTHLKILRLAAPIILANLSIPLLGAVDTAILGHLDSAIHLGAVAIGSQIITVMLWVFGFLRMGTTSVASRLHGADDELELHLLIVRSLLLGVTLGASIIIVSPWVLPWAIQLIAGDNPASHHAEVYAHIRVWSAPASLCTYAVAGWFIGCHNTRITAILLVVTNSLNIVLDLILIIGLGLESRGAAYASMISEYCGFVLAITLLLKAGTWKTSVPWRSKLWERSALKALFTLNAHIMVRTFALVMTTTFFVSMSSRFGETTLAANAILISLLYLTAFGMDGIANATEAMVGKAFGERNHTNLKHVIRASLQAAFCFSLLFSLTFLFGRTGIIDLYTDLAEVSAMATLYMPWVIAIPLISFWGFQYDGIFIGLGLGREMMFTMLFAVILIFFPVWWLSRSIGNHGLWLALYAWYLGRAISQWYLLRHKLKQIVQ